MTPQQLQAMKLGLEALQSGDYWIGVEAVNAIHKALAQPEQDPICPDCKAKVLYECVACSSNNYPPKENT